MIWIWEPRDTVCVTHQGSVIQSSLSKVTHCELNLHPAELSSSPHREAVPSCEVSPSLESVAVMTFLNVRSDQCVFVHVCMHVTAPETHFVLIPPVSEVMHIVGVVGYYCSLSLHRRTVAALHV